MNTAIIVAAGSGTRFGGYTPKQFLKIHGKPLIIYTIERFQECSAIDEIVLVLPERETENFAKIPAFYNLTKVKKIVAGGKTRTQSVLNGFNTVDSKRAKIIAVHDGARPLVQVDEISKTIAKALETGAACLVGTVTDTIKKVKRGKIVRTVDRNQLRRALTPQCFQYHILRRAFESISVDESATDECFIVEQSGYEVAVVEGSAANIKITTAEDFAIVEKALEKSKPGNV